MRIFIINMEKDLQRRQDMEAQLDKLGVAYEFFEGVDGKSLSDEKLASIADAKQLENSKKRPFSELKGLVGCTYSHYLVYKKIVSENISVACILEDDVILSENFKTQIDWLEDEIKSNEVVSLHTLLYDPIHFKPLQRSNAACAIHEPQPPKIRGTQGYVITPYCAEQIMKEMMPIKEFPDCFNRYSLFCEDVQIRVLFPFIMRHMWIDSVRDDKRSSLKSQVFNFVQQHRIFPFWHMIRTRRRRVNDSYISSFINNGEVEKLYTDDLVKTSVFDKI